MYLHARTCCDIANNASMAMFFNFVSFLFGIVCLFACLFVFLAFCYLLCSFSAFPQKGWS